MSQGVSLDLMNVWSSASRTTATSVSYKYSVDPVALPVVAILQVRNIVTVLAYFVAVRLFIGLVLGCVIIYVIRG